MADKQTTSGKELARKITVATVTGGPKKWKGKLIALAGLDAEGVPQNPNATLKLMQVYGMANSVGHGVTDFGEFTRFYGQFRAVSLLEGATGEIVDSPQCLLQPFLAKALEGALNSANGAQVSFAFEIHARYSPTAAQMFEYVIFDKLPAQIADPLASLEVAMGIRPALEAPKGENAPKIDDGTVAPAPAASKGRK